MPLPQRIAEFDTLPLEFGRAGTLLQPAQAQAALAALTPQVSDLLVVSHGWNNDTAEADALYARWLEGLRAQIRARPDPLPRRILVWRVFWPSKRFADSELIPGGAASLDDKLGHLRVLLQRLAEPDPPAAAPEPGSADAVALAGAQARAAFVAQVCAAMEGLLPLLDEDEGAQDDFARLARLLLGQQANAEEPVLDDSFYTLPGPELLRLLGGRWSPPAGADGGALGGALGGAAVLGGLGDAAGPEAQGGAAFLGNLWRGVVNGARNLLNLATYYEMKQRAGEVGRLGLAPLLQAALVQRPALRLHLGGHSFGGRLMAAAMSTLAPPAAGASGGVCSVMLMQAAFSHNGFGQRYDGRNDGAFRAAVLGGRLRGPMLITHTARDLAVGLAYPVASRLRGQVASGLGDANDPYGALGRNGALFVSDLVDPAERQLRPLGQAYGTFRPGRIYNLEGNGFITGHGDVERAEMAQAWWQALRAVAA